MTRMPSSGRTGLASVSLIASSTLRVVIAANACRRVEQTLRFGDDRVVDELAVELDRRRAGLFGLGKGGDDALGAGDLLGGGREDAVDRNHLVGVDAHLALVAEALGALRRLAAALGVGEVGPHRIDRRLEPGGSARDRDGGAGMRELRLVA